MSDKIAITTAEQMKNLVYEIRGQKIMLDVDLAKIYGYDTKAFNQQVKRNIKKFDDDFMFQLTEYEMNNLRSQNVTTNLTNMSRSLPYAFTEQGVYMLMTVLKGELATRQSKALIRLFKEMKDYISCNTLVGMEDFLKVSIQTNENTIAIAQIESEMRKKPNLSMMLKAFSNENPKEYLFMNGEICEAYSTYQKIYSKAKKSIYIIDDYISLDTLLMLKHINTNIDIAIFSDNKQNHLRLTEYNKFVIEYPNIHISFIQNNNIFHDGYIILDYGIKTEKVYHCGASSKDAGKKITTITESKENKLYKDMVNTVLQHKPLLIV